MNNKYKIKGRLLFLLAGVLFLNIDSNAQNSTKSPYSSFGIGEISSTTNSKLAGVAGAGIAYDRPNTLNFINPASLVNIDSLKFIFNFGAQVKMATLNENGLSDKFVDYNISQLAFGFKAASFWGTSLILSPYSNVGYSVSRLEMIGQNEYVQKTIKGSGGLSQIAWSNGFKLYKGLSVGVNTALLFGNNVKTETIFVSGGANSDKSTSKIKVASFYANASLQYSFQVNKKEKYTLGLTYQPKYNMTADNTNKIEDASGALSSDKILRTRNFSLPAKYGAGISYTRNNQLWVGVDYAFEQWSKATYLRGASDVSQGDTEYIDRQRFSFGLEYNANDGYARKFYNKLTYRLGAFHDSGYLKLRNNEISSMGLTAGLSIPMANHKGNINLALEYGQTGVTNNKLVREDYFKLTLAVNLFENWFFQRKYD